MLSQIELGGGILAIVKAYRDQLEHTRDPGYAR